MTQKEREEQKKRLVELLSSMTYFAPKDYINRLDIDWCADYLLSHGAIMPPCKVGDMVYSLERDLWGDPVSQVIEFIWFTKDQIVLTTKSWNVPTAWLGDNYYLTRKEAEQALKEREEK